MINITDKDFVDKKFHENREEDGGIKITEENKARYGNMERLEKIHVEDGWGTEEGKLYTPDMTGYVFISRRSCQPFYERIYCSWKDCLSKRYRDEHGSSTSTWSLGQISPSSIFKNSFKI